MYDEYNFIYYKTDSSFDYGDWPGATCYQIDLHGFSINIDCENNPDFDSLEGFGDYAEINDLKSLDELKDYILSHMKEIRFEQGGTDPECFLELVSFIEEKRKCA